MASIQVAVAQFAPGEQDNLPEIARLTQDAASRGARLVVFPEYSSYFRSPLDASFAENAQTLDGTFVAGLREVAEQHDVTLVVGLVERTASDRVHNTVVAVDASGIRARYRKQHLYDAFGDRESEWVAPGETGEPETFVVDGVRFGLMTCYDLRFPEVARTIVDAGADAIIVPSEWVRGPLKEDHWMTLIRARAIENTVYVAASDHVPSIGVGRSMIVDPSGIVLAALGTQPGVAVAPVDTDELARVRAVNPALALRRYRVTAR